MTLYIKGTDVQVCGTLESMKGVTLIAGLNDDGTLIYVGEVNVKHNHFKGVIENTNSWKTVQPFLDNELGWNELPVDWEE